MLSFPQFSAQINISLPGAAFAGGAGPTLLAAWAGRQSNGVLGGDEDVFALTVKQDGEVPDCAC